MTILQQIKNQVPPQKRDAKKVNYKYFVSHFFALFLIVCWFKKKNIAVSSVFQFLLFVQTNKLNLQCSTLVFSLFCYFLLHQYFILESGKESLEFTVLSLQSFRKLHKIYHFNFISMVLKNKINSSGYLSGSLLFYLLVKTQGPMEHGLVTSSVQNFL